MYKKPTYLYLTWTDPSTEERQEFEAPLDLLEPITIGSRGDNTIVLASYFVSRHHATLESVGDALLISDQKSRNGILVNEKSIEPETPTALKNGDSFQIGPFFFTVAIRALAQQIIVRWSKKGSEELYEDTVDLPVSLGRGAKNSIVLPDSEEQISRHQADIKVDGEQLVLIDHSLNGTLVNGELYKEQQAVIQSDSEIEIGDYKIKVEFLEGEVTQAKPGSGPTRARPGSGPTRARPGSGPTRVMPGSGKTSSQRKDAMLPFEPNTDSLQPVPVLTSSAISLPELFKNKIIPYDDLQRARMPLQETTYLAIGGGIGSFAWVDHLIIYGAEPKQIVAVGFKPKTPYGRYQQLCNNSQIPAYERLRSNSDSCPDNIWGWPGYAVREMWGLVWQGDIIPAGKMAWQIFNEPLAETYTPRSGDVFASIDREAARIGWDSIWRYGQVEGIRQTDDGRYVIVYTQPSDKTPMLMIADYVHLSVGYPGVRFLPDLVAYRKRTGDKRGVVNAYENHEHVYEHLTEHGGTILLRGRGIVASRIFQRLHEVREKRLREKKKDDIRFLHLMRTPKPEGHQFGRARRVVVNHWEFQPFNWPKATWGGPMRFQLERTHDRERDKLLSDWGGTTTAKRHDWQMIVETGLRERWYVQEVGEVERVNHDPKTNQVVTVIRSKDIGGMRELPADFIIDATGLDAKLDSNPLLNDLMEQYNLERNAKGRFAVANDFEIVGMRNQQGRMYAAGVMTLGGPYAPVDTFLGLQYAALRSVDALSKLQAPRLKKLNGIRSIWQWIKWARGVQP